MQEKMYYLMHRNEPVCMVSIDPISGAMLRVSQKKVEICQESAFEYCGFESFADRTGTV